MEDLCACADRMVDAARAESGTEVYFVARSTREPDTLFLFELFTDKAALKEHAAGGQAVGEMISPYIESAEVVIGEPLAAKGLGV
jgi:quinol monooxygenase YgiN